MKLQDAKVSVANTELRAARDRFVDLVAEQQITTENVELGWQTRWNPLRAAFAQPGDIVGSDDTGEYTQPLFATVEIILKGAEVRRRIEERLHDKAQKNATDAARIDPVRARGRIAHDRGRSRAADDTREDRRGLLPLPTSRGP